MMADPARVKIAVALAVFAAALVFTFAGGGTTPDPVEAPEPAPTAPEPEPAPDVPVDEAPDIDGAMAAAERFGIEYLTWHEGESAADRAARITPHATDDLAQRITDANVHDQEGDPHAQDVDIVTVLPQTSRRNRVEVSIIADVGTPDGTVRTRLGVAMTREGDQWAAHDMK